MDSVQRWLILLGGDLEQEFFVDFPKVIDEAKPMNVLVLNKSIYGLVQSELQYHKKAVQILQKLDLKVEMLTHVFTCARIKLAQYLRQ